MIQSPQLAERLRKHCQTVGGWERGEGLPKSRTVVLEIAKALRLTDQETRQLLDASFTSPEPHWLVPYPRNLLFTGREEALATLHQYLAAEKTVVLTQSYAVYGLGGVGKTQLALEYAYRYALEYSAVFWISSETLEQITSSFGAIAETLQLPERQSPDQHQMIATVQRWLNTHRGWLLIWDNVEDMELLPRFLAATPLGAHLITTRTSVQGTRQRALELFALSSEHALLFLLRRAKLLGTFAAPRQLSHWAQRHPVAHAAARELIQELAGLPLALDQAGAYIEETGCGLAGYLDRYQKQRGFLLARRGFPDAGHPESVMTTFALASQRLERAYPAAMDLLRVCSYLSAEAIPEELFQKPLPELGAVLKDVLGKPIEFDLAIAALLRLSLVQRQAETHTLSLHRLVQAVQQEVLDKESQQWWAEVAVRLVAAAFPDAKEFANWEWCQRLLPHALECARHIRRWGFSFPETARLLNEVGTYLFQRAQFDAALPLLEQGLAIREQLLDPLEVAESVNNLGGCYYTQGLHEQALSFLQRA